MKKQLLAFVLISFVLFNIGCKKAPTEPNETLSVSVEDVSCTEAWVKVTSANFQNPSSLILFVDDMPNQTLTLVSSDTLLYVDSLLPNRSYKIKATFAANNRQQTTNEVVATTMDTTSHNFSWQTFTFGEHSSSVLYDVAIIDENNIWAVGEIYTKDSYTYDSLGKWIDPYNAVHWNGSDWELIRIYYNYRGTPSWSPIRTIFAFANNDIWYSSGLHWNGKIFEQPDNGAFDGWEPNKMWGTSSSDLYAVGNNGNIAHYDGKNWQKLESGTTLNINDIWGIKDNSGNNLIYCPAYNFGSGGGKKLLKIEGNKIGEINWVQNKELYTCWFNTPHKLYAGGEGLFYKVYGNWKEEVISHYFVFRVRGNSLSDIWAAGGFGFAAHFNGSSWRVFDEVTLTDGNYYGLTVKENLISLVGREGRKAVITLGRKY